jgi:hypothetical protein
VSEHSWEQAVSDFVFFFYYLVRFTDIPFVLQEPSPVEGCNGEDMPKGTTVVEGRYWN